jgi:hypothetical protein
MIDDATLKERARALSNYVFSRMTQRDADDRILALLIEVRDEARKEPDALLAETCTPGRVGMIVFPTGWHGRVWEYLERRRVGQRS